MQRGKMQPNNQPTRPEETNIMHAAFSFGQAGARSRTVIDSFWYCTEIFRSCDRWVLPKLLYNTRLGIYK